MADVSMNDVVKAYDDKEVLHGISVDVANGEFMVIVGPSGCGKSTLLRLVAGLEEITSGKIAIAGRVVNDVAPKDRNIAMVFQNYALYPHMNVFDNMAYGLRLRGMPRQEITGRVQQAAELLQIEELLGRKPRQLSGGQRQRVAMGRAIVRNPDVFLFDEPLSNLDAKLRAQMRVEIRKLQQRLGVTTLYVTHDQVEAMTMGDRLIVLNDGNVEQIGTPMELYESPATRFVAGFIGSPAMNFLTGELDDGKIHLGRGVALPCPPEAPPATRITVGIRPEHLAHSKNDSAADMRLHVDVIEILGADTLVHGKVTGTNQTAVVRLQGPPRFSVNDVIGLTIQPEKLSLFHPDTGKRL